MSAFPFRLLSMPFTADAPAVQIPSSTGEPITSPVYLELKIRAHPDYAHVSSSDFRNMLSLIPVGHGYAGEADLQALNNTSPTAYDGIAPAVWWGYAHLRWWPNPSPGAYPEVVSKGVCWANPATVGSPESGVIRHIVLEEGQFYRFIVAYNTNSPNGLTYEFLSKGILALNPPGPEGDSFDNPLHMQVYLGKTANYDAANEPHNIDSFVIFDNDRDGLSDAEEFIYATDPLNADTDGDSLPDGEEDSDADGHSNHSESLNATSPFNPADFFSLGNDQLFHGIHPTGQPEVSFNWHGIGNRLYTVLKSDDPAGGWTPVAGYTDLPGADAPLNFSDSLGQTSQFYKIQVRPAD